MIASVISKRRLLFLRFFIFALFLIIFYQVLQLMVFHRAALKDLADRQHLLNVEVPPFRGLILDRNAKEFAANLKVPSIYAVPRLINEKQAEVLASKLELILGLSKKFLFDRLKRHKSFIWLKRRTSFEVAEKIRALKTPALGVLEESKRFYPQGDLLSQIIGYTNVDGQGIEGLELFLDKELKGEAGKRVSKRDALGREVKAFETRMLPALDGHSVVLTIDQHLQYLTERALERAYTQWHAKGATAVVMNPHTGEILALANRPTYDPNDYQKVSPEHRRNRAITDVYEPGSVFKIIATSAALNEGKVTPDQIFFCENGAYHYGSKVLHDVHAYGNLTFEEVLIKSSNIGVVKVAALLDHEVFYQYVKKYGFGARSGIDFPGESPGFVRPPARWSNTSPYNIPIGHEVTVNAVQIATAMAVLANGGNLVKPYMISEIKDQAGVVLKEYKPVIKHRVLRPEIAYKMRKILERVVNEGTGKAAKIEEIPTGGKTGTAQKVLSGGRGYSHSNFISSFVGMAPIEEPLIVMSVVLDDPHPSYYGGTVAAPVFKEVVEAGLLYLGYSPENAKVLGEEEKLKPSSQGNPPKRKQASLRGIKESPRPSLQGRSR